MKKKDYIIILIVALLVFGSVGGYFLYNYLRSRKEPNLDVVNEKMEIATRDSSLAEGKAPVYTDVSADAKGLYPSLSGAYEPIWDQFESYPIEISCKESDILEMNRYLFGYYNPVETDDSQTPEGATPTPIPTVTIPEASEGDNSVSASYKLIWSKRYLYIQVTVNDASKDCGGEHYFNQDSVEVFINEDGQKNSQLLVGDAFYVVNRDNVRTSGFGAADNFESVVYQTTNEEGAYTGYVVEMIIPLLTIKANKNASIGFDIQVNNAREGVNVATLKWASDYIFNFQNFSSLGTLTFK